MDLMSSGHQVVRPLLDTCSSTVATTRPCLLLAVNRSFVDFNKISVYFRAVFDEIRKLTRRRSCYQGWAKLHVKKRLTYVCVSWTRWKHFWKGVQLIPGLLQAKFFLCSDFQCFHCITVQMCGNVQYQMESISTISFFNRWTTGVYILTAWTGSHSFYLTGWLNEWRYGTLQAVSMIPKWTYWRFWKSAKRQS